MLKDELLKMNQSIYARNLQKFEHLLTRAGINSFKELSILSGIPQRELFRLLYGLAPKMNVETLVKLSQTLNISLNQLLSDFWPESSNPLIIVKAEESQNVSLLKQEYQLLEQQLAQQKENNYQDFQRSALNIIESWLLQWPTAIAIASKNPKFPASQLIPLVKPLERLLTDWGIEAIASVGSEVPYDPQLHQLMEGNTQVGEPVKVRYVGYRQGEKLLYRAKVSPILDTEVL